MSVQSGTIKLDNVLARFYIRFADQSSAQGTRLFLVT